MSSRLKVPVSNKDHIQGNTNATIELIEYGDYQCTHCGIAYKIIKKIQKVLDEDLKFIFRNFPLSETHTYAYPAALATEAAALQGKFWEMHDIIYEHQSHLRDSDLFDYANKIGLDINKFQNDFQSEDLLYKIENDFEGGMRSGVNGTPTFFINGMKYTGNWQKEDEFVHYLKAALVS